EAIEIAEQYTRQGMYTPMTEVVEGGNQGTWIYPGYGGGSNWNAAAFDPNTHMMYVPIRHKVYIAGLSRGDPEITDLPWVRTGGGILQGPRGLPILKPPYSELVMTDMDAGEHVWRVPTGAAPDFVQNHPDLREREVDFEHMGQWDIRPSPLLTSEVLFLSDASNISGTSGSEMFYALDPETGARVWETALPSLGTGTPMTYMDEGRQFIVIGVSSRDHPAELVALALPGEDGPAEVAAPVAVAEATTSGIVLTEEEAAAGAQEFATNCAVCHGVNGVGVPGSNAPSLIGFTDYDYVRDIVRAGGVEMPAMTTLMTDEQIEMVVRYVAAGLTGE
ncbi:MAG: c-type cytochrome, partial [Maricaulaceae bacterium]